MHYTLNVKRKWIGSKLPECLWFVLKNKQRFFFCHLTCQTITLVTRVPPAGWGSFFICDFWNFQNTPLFFSEAVAWRPEVIEAVPAQSSAGRRWNPSAFRAWGAHRSGDSHLQSPFAWVNSLQRLTQWPLCLFMWTFKGCYITPPNEQFNGKDHTELFCKTSWSRYGRSNGNKMLNHINVYVMSTFRKEVWGIWALGWSLDVIHTHTDHEINLVF